MYLSDFKSVRPRYSLSQEHILDWVAKTHARDNKKLRDKVFEKLSLLGLGPEKIQTRGTVLSEVIDGKKELFCSQFPSTMSEKMACYDREVRPIFDQLYPSPDSLSPFLLHVTCTGYVAPSPAQKWVAEHELGDKVWVNHAYHMGCYAAMPAIQIASGIAERENTTVDIAHTELCSLHVNPDDHSMAQLVIETLFADGFIRYRVGGTLPESGFRLLGMQQQTLPNTAKSMTWTCASWGMEMTIDKRVPIYFARILPEFLDKLAQKGRCCSKELKKGMFAIHPGGPKIIESVADVFALENSQYEHSKRILQTCGNMSSATIPHIWEAIGADPKISTGTKITSIAFGPGLSITGAILEKL